MASSRSQYHEIQRSSIVVSSKDQVFCELADEVVILNQAAGTYFGLDAVGARIWELVKEPTSVGDACDQLLEEFDVDPERCESEVIDLIERLLEESLVEIVR